MAYRRSSALSPWFSLARTTLRATEKLGKAARKGAPALGRLPGNPFAGLAAPARPARLSRDQGRWLEGRWGLGPLASRRYLLYLPPGASLHRPVPLVMLLHGCGQDAAGFARLTRAAAAARAGGFAALLPEQAAEANVQRCWNWFRPEPVVALETGILAAIASHACSAYPLRRDRIFALGLSAGGAMALTLALHHPELLAAVGTHSGALPGSAETALQAGQAMRGRRGPGTEGWRRHLAARGLPPLFALHGEADRTVAPANARAAAELWLELADPAAIAPRGSRRSRLGNRHSHSVADWSRDGHPYVRLIQVEGLGHAWSGGAAGLAYADPDGPDALKLAWRFFRQFV